MPRYSYLAALIVLAALGFFLTYEAHRRLGLIP